MYVYNTKREERGWKWWWKETSYFSTWTARQPYWGKKNLMVCIMHIFKKPHVGEVSLHSKLLKHIWGPQWVRKDWTIWMESVESKCTKSLNWTNLWVALPALTAEYSFHSIGLKLSGIVFFSLCWLSQLQAIMAVSCFILHTCCSYGL